MSPEEERVRQAWEEAARDLGFRFTAPFPHNASDASSFMYTGLVHDFGGPKGALLAIIGPETSRSFPHAEGFHVSLLNAASYSRYHRQHFIDTLDDLGWFGPESAKPSWYTGKPWTS